MALAPNDPPTPRQLRYLRDLAVSTGTTYAVPKTWRDARAEINRLKRLPRSSPMERTLERDALARDVEASRPASSVRPDEISGYGSGARWKGRHAR
jgi:hypothetical protein